MRVSEDEVLARTGELYYSLQLADALGRLSREAGDIVDQAKNEIDRLLEEGSSDVDYADLFQVEITEQEVRLLQEQIAAARDAQDASAAAAEPGQPAPREAMESKKMLPK